MSTRPAASRLRLPELGEMKRRGDKIVMVTAYDAPAALLADQSGVELILVGDTAAMVMLGHESTVPVTLDEMIFLTRAVTRSAERPIVIGDLPFGSYEISDEQAVGSAIRLVKEGGAGVVKLEGAGRMVSRVRAIAESNIGVMAHVGLTPQSATKLGGFRAQGRTAEAALKLYDDAHALQDAGAFAIVFEAVPAAVATRITQSLEIPTIGIGAGAGCDGQVLVWHDLLGLYPGNTPRFVKRYGDIAEEISVALGDYVTEVRTGAFPEEQHTYSIPAEELDEFEAALSGIGRPAKPAGRFGSASTSDASERE
ncbi:MAG TPA: 3-methyl-2-oxobutanoate hydroxymethyltransferase [Gaiellaceae bacterium]|jgi:3-methyl-2-oxobutanoate hydroxymethyltransferase